MNEAQSLPPLTREEAARILRRCHQSLKLAYARGEVTIDDLANVCDLPAREQKAALARVQAKEARTLTAAAAARSPGRTGMSVKTAAMIVWFQGKATILAETAPLAIDMVRERLKDFVDEFNDIRVGPAGEEPRKVEFCTRPGCGAALFEGDKRRQGPRGPICHECPDGKC